MHCPPSIPGCMGIAAFIEKFTEILGRDWLEHAWSCPADCRDSRHVLAAGCACLGRRLAKHPPWWFRHGPQGIRVLEALLEFRVLRNFGGRPRIASGVAQVRLAQRERHAAPS
jgi:hypothetical protein